MKKSISSLQSSRTFLIMNLIIASASSISPSRSQNAISGSTIQNSAAWRAVWESSALNVGPNVYTFEKAIAIASADNCPDTVKDVFLEKKSCEGSVFLVSSRVVTLNISPAPSQSEDVMIGVFTYTNSLLWKNSWIAWAITLLTLKTARNVLVRGLKCAISLKYSIECLLFCNG